MIQRSVVKVIPPRIQRTGTTVTLACTMRRALQRAGPSAQLICRETREAHLAAQPTAVKPPAWKLNFRRGPKYKQRTFSARTFLRFSSSTLSASPSPFAASASSMSCTMSHIDCQSSSESPVRLPETCGSALTVTRCSAIIARSFCPTASCLTPPNFEKAGRVLRTAVQVAARFAFWPNWALCRPVASVCVRFATASCERSRKRVIVS